MTLRIAGAERVEVDLLSGNAPPFSSKQLRDQFGPLADAMLSVGEITRNRPDGGAWVVRAGGVGGLWGVAIDGTRLAGNARAAKSEYRQIAQEIVAEARALDEAEDELYGDARGGQLPEWVASSQGRRRLIEEAAREDASSADRDAEGSSAEQSAGAGAFEFDAERIVARV